mmetsp:Transcript_80884/g.187811  ORF Transcript_80884/g.187811 Transcript_80884/m.187811 type:complete len:142 (+) Transcript_80884:71-496(+)
MGAVCCKEDPPHTKMGENVDAAMDASPQPKTADPAPVPEMPEHEASTNYTEFSITLEKDNVIDKIGADVGRKPEYLVILKVKKPGLLAVYNETHPHQQVMQHDRIVEVNGKSGDANAILVVLAMESVLHLKIRRDIVAKDE